MNLFWDSMYFRFFTEWGYFWGLQKFQLICLGCLISLIYIYIYFFFYLFIIIIIFFFFFGGGGVNRP